LNHAVNDSTQLSVNARMSQRHPDSTWPAYSTALFLPETDPFYVNPTGGHDPVEIDYSFGRLFGPIHAQATDTAGGIASNARVNWHAWNLSAHLNYYFEDLHQTQHNFLNLSALNNALADADASTAFDPFSLTINPATVEKIRATYSYRSWSDLRTFNFSADRSLLTESAGDVSVSIGGEYRKQRLFSVAADPNQGTVREDLGRNVTASFVDFVVPVFGKDNRRTLLNELELQLGARYENYGQLSALTRKAGLIWSPDTPVTFRSTWGQSFRPPALTDLSESLDGNEVVVLPDAKSPTGQSTVVVWFGGNPELRAERATTWTVGLDWRPVTGASFTATYFDTLVRERVDDPVFTFDVLQDPTFGGVILRNPTPAQRLSACGRGTFYVDPAGCLAAPIIIDDRTQNEDSLRSRGMEFVGKREFEAVFGKMSVDIDTKLAAVFRGSFP
jgi:outer membrane receptor protein involved in Fe transport